MPDTPAQYDEIIARMEREAEELELRAEKRRAAADAMRAISAEGEGAVQSQESSDTDASREELMRLRLQTAENLLRAAEIVVRAKGHPMSTPEMVKELRRYKYPYDYSDEQLSKSLGLAIRKTTTFERIALGVYALRNGLLAYVGKEGGGSPVTSAPKEGRPD